MRTTPGGLDAGSIGEERLFRLVASDVDGTLVPYGGELGGATIEAVAELGALGVPVVLATGRPPRWVGGLVAELGCADLVVCANGALILDAGSGEILDVTPLPPAVIRSALRALGERWPGLEALVDVANVGGEDSPPVRLAAGQVEGELASVPNGYPIKLLVRLPRERAGSHGSGTAGSAPDQSAAVQPGDATDVRRGEATDGRAAGVAVGTGNEGAEPRVLARRLLDGLVEVTSSSDPYLLEISAAGVTKASAVAKVAAAHSLDASAVVAFGDMPNDVPLLEWAGWGVAMTGGHPAAITVADEVAPPAEEDGVAVVVRRLAAQGRLRRVGAGRVQQRAGLAAEPRPGAERTG